MVSESYDHDPVFAPSSAERRFGCPGSYRVEKDLPEKKDKYNTEGSTAHKALELIMNGNDAVSLTNTDAQVKGRACKINQEMVDHAQYLVELIRFMFPEEDWLLNSEKRVKLHHFDLPIFGTADISGISKDHKNLLVLDYKYGAGQWVSAYMNKQMLMYALGVLADYAEYIDEIEDITICIYQPRVNTNELLDQFTIDKDILINWLEEELRPAYAKVLDENAELIPGEHCLFCKGKKRGACPHFTALAKTVIQMTESNLVPQNINDSLLEEITLYADQMIEFIKCCKDEAETRIKAGGKFEKIKLVKKRGKRIWSDQVDETKIIDTCRAYLNRKPGDFSVYEEPPPPKLKSPSKMETTFKDAGFKKKEFAHFMEDLIVQSDSGTTVAPMSDKRPEYKPTLTFSKIETGE